MVGHPAGSRCSMTLCKYAEIAAVVMNFENHYYDRKKESSMSGFASRVFPVVTVWNER
jgi:hypothetical protein